MEHKIINLIEELDLIFKDINYHEISKKKLRRLTINQLDDIKFSVKNLLDYNLPRKNKITKLAKEDPLIATCYNMFKSGEFSYDQALAEMVVALADQNERLNEQIYKESLKKTPSIRDILNFNHHSTKSLKGSGKNEHES